MLPSTMPDHRQTRSRTPRQTRGPRTLLAAGLGLSVLLAAGCGSVTRLENFVPGEPVEIRGLTPLHDRPLALDIQNVRGPVTVLVDRDLLEPEVRVQAGQVGVHNLARLQKEISQTARVFRTDNGSTLEVRATPIDPHIENLFVNLTIRVPRCDELIVRSAGGAVTVIGVHGPVNILCGAPGEMGGDIRVRTTAPLVGPVLVATSGGNVEMLLGAGTAGDFLLQTDSGVVRLETAGARVQRVSNTGSSWSGLVNGGQNLFELRSRSGNVRAIVGEGAWENARVNITDSMTR